MEALMKWNIIGLFLSIFLLHSCSKEEIGPRTIEGNWIVTSYEDYETATSITKTEENTWSDSNNGDVTVRFSFTKEMEGEISGINVTNIFNGGFLLKSDRRITIGPLITTRVGEPEWAAMFHSITLAESYEVDENRLIIFYNNKKNAIVLERI